MIDEAEIKEFLQWKKAKNKNELEEAFHQLEMTLEKPGSRQFNAVMPSLAYRTLANAIIALKKELIP
jgi:hypothetical protein